MEPISNQQIADVLFNIATLLEMQQGNPYRIEAYRNAARGMLALPVQVTDVIAQGARLEAPGLGNRLRRKITELATTGHMTFYEDLCEESLPADARDLMRVPHVGPRTAIRPLRTGSIFIASQNWRRPPSSTSCARTMDSARAASNGWNVARAVCWMAR